MKPITYTQSIFIDAPRNQVWEKLTSHDTLSPFYHYSIMRLEKGLTKGSRITYDVSGMPYVEGEIRDVDPSRKFSHTFRFLHLDDEPTLVTWELEDEGDGTRLKLIHEELAKDSQTEKDVSSERGWPEILDRLKREIEQQKYV